MARAPPTMGGGVSVQSGGSIPIEVVEEYIRNHIAKLANDGRTSCVCFREFRVYGCRFAEPFAFADCVVDAGAGFAASDAVGTCLFLFTEIAKADLMKALRTAVPPGLLAKTRSFTVREMKSMLARHGLLPDDPRIQDVIAAVDDADGLVRVCVE